MLELDFKRHFPWFLSTATQTGDSGCLRPDLCCATYEIISSPSFLLCIMGRLTTVSTPSTWQKLKSELLPQDQQLVDKDYFVQFPPQLACQRTVRDVAKE